MKAKARRPLEWSTSLLGIGAIFLVGLGWAAIGWPVLAAAGIAALLVKVL
jgi:hypothetical protein